MKQQLRTLAALALVACIAGAYVIALADTLATNEKPSVYRFNATYVSASGTTTYMDSLKNIRAYPIGEDTTSNGKDCYWIGTGRKLFGLQVDSTDVFKFYETTGPDTAITGMDSVLVWTTIGGAPEGFISSSRAFGDTVIDAAAIKASAVTTARIADSAIDSSKIAAAAVQTTDLATDAVTAAKVADGAIDDSAKVAASVITQTRIADDAVVSAKVADGAISDSAQVAAGVVTMTRLADDAVTSAKLADGAVADSAQMGAGVVTVTRLASDAVTSEKIADGAIADSAQIGTGVVTVTKLATGAVTEDKLADGSVSGPKLAGGTMAAGKIYYATSGEAAAWKDTLETTLYLDNIIMAENAQFGDGYITMNGGKVLIDGDDGSITGEILHAHGVVFHIGELTPAATFQDSLPTYIYRMMDLDSLSFGGSAGSAGHLPVNSGGGAVSWAYVDSASVSAIGSGDITDGQVKLADLASTAVDSSKVASGSLARSDLAIGGSATAGNVPASTGSGWAWAAPDSGLVANGSLSFDDVKISGTPAVGSIVRATGTDGAAWATWKTGSATWSDDGSPGYRFALYVPGLNASNNAFISFLCSGDDGAPTLGSVGCECRTDSLIVYRSSATTTNCDHFVYLIF